MQTVPPHFFFLVCVVSHRVANVPSLKPGKPVYLFIFLIFFLTGKIKTDLLGSKAVQVKFAGLNIKNKRHRPWTCCVSYWRKRKKNGKQMKMALDFRFPHVLFKTFSRLCTLLGEFAGNEPNVCLFLFSH